MARRPTFRRSAPAPALPERATPPSGLNRAHLIEQVRATSTRPEVCKLLSENLSAALDRSHEQFTSARLGGLETARRISAIHDDILAALWVYATDMAHPEDETSGSEPISLCAVGGYGRGEMAPYSDLDLLFVTANKKDHPRAEDITQTVLYMLWDMGLKVGHAIRTPEQCVALAKSDQTILTSLLDLRYLAGDETLAATLHGKLRTFLTKSSNRAYIADKLEERDKRHEREGNSRYQIEPDVKEGKGGLRDLHVLYWIATFLDNLDGEVEDANSGERYVSLGLFDRKAAGRFERASDFLWRTRIYLHHAAGRAQETLSFDYQVKLAPLMGHALERPEQAVERFMREYFTNTREVGALTRIACARLESRNAIRLPKGLDALLPNSKRNMRNKSFILDHGRLMFRDPMTIRDRPAQIMELFEIAGRRNLDIHPDAIQAIDYRRNLIDNHFRRDPEISEIFQTILTGAKVPGATLRIMNEAGVLGRYLLEFGGIVGRTQFNMHHAYTVDEHTLKLVSYLNDIEQGVFRREHPFSTRIVGELSEEQRLSLYLACLLHDTGKGVGDQCVEGARLARRACRRLGVSKTVIDDVAWLVRSHLVMSETAQRRDLSDPDTIERFAKLVGSQARLDLLTLLTVVDIRSVGPGIWNDWKGTLLRELYVQTESYLKGHTDLAPAARAVSQREQLLERLPEELSARVRPLITDLPDSYWQVGDMEDFVRHARFFSAAIEQGGDTHTRTRRDRARDITELWVLTRNREGLFADLTLAIAASGAQISGARLTTSPTGQVFNIFFLQNTNGFAFGRESDVRLAKVAAAAKRAAEGDVSGLTAPTRRRSRRAAAIPVHPKVALLDDQIIEIEGRDRPGLLHELASVLRAHDLEVTSAHIEVVGTCAVDVIYVQHLPPDDEGLRADLLGVLLAQKENVAA